MPTVVRPFAFVARLPEGPLDSVAFAEAVASAAALKMFTVGK